MIEGAVNEALEPVIEIGLKRSEITLIPAMPDTGFSVYLCLAEHHVEQLDIT